MLTKGLIEQRMSFWGYGSFEAPTWFVGMEEGLEPDATLAHLSERFLVADGKQSTDMRLGMERVYGHSRWFNTGARIQPTWKYPIALYLYFKLGHIPSKEEILNHQAFALGDSEAKETMTVELMPLPSNKVHECTWLYGDLGIPGLSTRAEYLAAYKPGRVQKLRELFHTYQPKLAIFYSLTYLPDWEAVISAKPEEITSGMYFAQSGETACCVIPQSASFGMSYDRLYEYAGIIRPMICGPRDEVLQQYAPTRIALRRTRLTQHYSSEQTMFRHRALLISVNRTADKMPLYEAVRFAWKLNKAKASQADIILATRQGIIVGAFEADGWLDATPENFPGRKYSPGRIGFIGHEAPDEIQQLYLNKCVPDEYRKPGSSNPVKYTW